VPRMRHGPGEVVRLLRGGVLPEVGETYSFIWSEIPGMEFSDTYINEWGVAVASNYCPTREDSYEELVARGEIVDGGIGYMLRRLVIQRARTAREGVRLAGELIEKFGYTDSGRTLVIADPNEAWLLSIVRGKHWVARRVPDDEVALLPNLHIICEVDLSDTNNFMGSPDIVDYAVRRGWFEPDEGRPFSFRRAYNRSDARDPRQELGQFLVTGRWPPGARRAPVLGETCATPDGGGCGSHTEGRPHQQRLDPGGVRLSAQELDASGSWVRILEDLRRPPHGPPRPLVFRHNRDAGAILQARGNPRTAHALPPLRPSSGDLQVRPGLCMVEV